MKTILFIIIGLSIALHSNAYPDNQAEAQTNDVASNTLKLMSAPELGKLATKWACEYEKLNPNLKVEVGEYTDKKPVALLNLSIVSSRDLIQSKTDDVWKMVVGRDAIVPIINATNPMMNEIYRHGFSAEKFAQLFTNPELQNWEALITSGEKRPIHLYFIGDETVKSNLSTFTKINTDEIGGISVANASELISAIKNDKYAIGFCKLTDVRDEATNTFTEGIKLLPIDKNRNGRIDNFERIYDNLDAFTRGVWIGKYPHDLCVSIYAAADSKPTGKEALDFLEWLMADGQQFLNQNGYSDLASIEIQSNLAALSGTKDTTPLTNEPETSEAWLYVLLIFVITASVVTAVVGYRRNRRLAMDDYSAENFKVFDENSIIVPKGLYFDKTHTWAFMEKDGNVKVGIDDFLQHITGTLNRIILKEPGEMVRKGEKIVTIVRDGKQLNIYAPISGKIIEQNQRLLSDTSIINYSPFSKGWVYVIEPKNWLREIQFLYMADTYREWLSDEFTRLKDFFASSAQSKNLVYAHVTLQDGGQLADNVLADLEPEIWEDFQVKFIDTSK